MIYNDVFFYHHLFSSTRLSGNHLLEEVLLGHTWTESAAIMLIKELLEAVAHVHEEGIVHLNIQVSIPSQIIQLLKNYK